MARATHGTCGTVYDPEPQRSVELFRPSVLSPIQVYDMPVMLCIPTAVTRIMNAGSRRAWKRGESFCCTTTPKRQRYPLVVWYDYKHLNIGRIPTFSPCTVRSRFGFILFSQAAGTQARCQSHKPGRHCIRLFSASLGPSPLPLFFFFFFSFFPFFLFFFSFLPSLSLFLSFSLSLFLSFC